MRIVAGERNDTASLIGTTIEFFDFYIYATAAVLVFPHLFFPASDPASATLQSLATFAIAFFARPVGSAVFGHLGDRIGRKSTLIAALLTDARATIARVTRPGAPVSWADFVEPLEEDRKSVV